MILFAVGLSVAATLAVAERQERLPGSELSIDVALGDAQIIVVASASHIGMPIMGGSAGSTYGTINLRPSRTLKGGAIPRNLRMGSFLVRSFLDKPGEVPPSEDEDYVFFIERRGPVTLRGIKILQATKEKLALVTAAQRRENRLPGSELGIFESVGRADTIVVGKLAEASKLQAAPLETGDDVAAKVIPDRTFKGEMEGMQLPRFKIARGSDETAERVPVAGLNYLFFIEKRQGVASNWFKMLPANESNIDKVFTAVNYPK